MRLNEVKEMSMESFFHYVVSALERLIQIPYPIKITQHWFKSDEAVSTLVIYFSIYPGQQKPIFFEMFVKYIHYVPEESYIRIVDNNPHKVFDGQANMMPPENTDDPVAYAMYFAGIINEMLEEIDGYMEEYFHLIGVDFEN